MAYNAKLDKVAKIVTEASIQKWQSKMMQEEERKKTDEKLKSAFAG